MTHVTHTPYLAGSNCSLFDITSELDAFDQRIKTLEAKLADNASIPTEKAAKVAGLAVVQNLQRDLQELQAWAKLMKNNFVPKEQITALQSEVAALRDQNGELTKRIGELEAVQSLQKQQMDDLQARVARNESSAVSTKSFDELAHKHTDLYNKVSNAQKQPKQDASEAEIKTLKGNLASFQTSVRSREANALDAHNTLAAQVNALTQQFQAQCQQTVKVASTKKGTGRPKVSEQQDESCLVESRLANLEELVKSRLENIEESIRREDGLLQNVMEWQRKMDASVREIGSSVGALWKGIRHLPVEQPLIVPAVGKRELEECIELCVQDPDNASLGRFELYNWENEKVEKSSCEIVRAINEYSSVPKKQEVSAASKPRRPYDEFSEKLFWFVHGTFKQHYLVFHPLSLSDKKLLMWIPEDQKKKQGIIDRRWNDGCRELFCTYVQSANPVKT